MTDLTTFLVRLAEDPALQERFRNDPAGTMAAEGLADADQETLLSGDQERIKSSIDPPRADGLTGLYLMFFIRDVT